jgi:GNAT superfamily N-acetyltransferase
MTATMTLRAARKAEAAALSALALRSKAHWGYDAAFMEACRAELTVTPERIRADAFVVAERDGRLAGFYALGRIGPREADVLKFFVDPPFIGSGVGRALFEHMAATARDHGYETLVIEADPDAAPFYARMGAVPAGTAPSGSIPGRVLPRFTYDLRDR